MARMRIRTLFFADYDATFQFGETNFIELVKVIGIDAQEAHAFNKRI